MSKTLIIPYSMPKFLRKSPAKFYFPSFPQRFSKFKILHDQVWNQTSKDISNISYFYSKQLMVIYLCDSFCVYFYLFGRFKSLKEFSFWIQHHNINERFLVQHVHKMDTTFSNKVSKKGSWNLVVYWFANIDFLSAFTFLDDAVV